MDIIEKVDGKCMEIDEFVGWVRENWKKIVSIRTIKSSSDFIPSLTIIGSLLVKTDDLEEEITIVSDSTQDLYYYSNFYTCLQKLRDINELSTLVITDPNVSNYDSMMKVRKEEVLKVKRFTITNGYIQFKLLDGTPVIYYKSQLLKELPDSHFVKEINKKYKKVADELDELKVIAFSRSKNSKSLKFENFIFSDGICKKLVLENPIYNEKMEEKIFKTISDVKENYFNLGNWYVEKEYFINHITDLKVLNNFVLNSFSSKSKEYLLKISEKNSIDFILSPEDIQVNIIENIPEDFPDKNSIILYLEAML